MAHFYDASGEALVLPIPQVQIDAETGSIYLVLNHNNDPRPDKKPDLSYWKGEIAMTINKPKCLVVVLKDGGVLEDETSVMRDLLGLEEGEGGTKVEGKSRSRSLGETEGEVEGGGVSIR